VRLLIDTHILLWADERPRLIAPTLRTAMRDEANEFVISAATIWEIAIKRAIGKLRFDRPIVAAVLALASRSCLWRVPMPSMPAACRRIITFRSID
jgi:PIN domain nuclease of toxin-antitoxin system